MDKRTRVWFWAMGLVVAVVISQPGCQQTNTPPAEEASGGAASGQAPAAAGKAPSGQSSAAKPQSAAAKPSAASGPAAAAAPRTATFGAGTALKVRTTTTVSTKSNKAGDTFVATLEEPLTEGDWVIAPKGATVEGRVVESDPGGRVKGVASLAIALQSLKTADGQSVSLSTNNVTVEAQSTKGKDAAKIGIGAAVGTAIGAIAGGKKGAAIGAATGAGAGTAVVLSTRGDAAEVGSETVLHFELSAPVTVRAAR